MKALRIMKVLDIACGQIPKLKSEYLEIDVVNCDIQDIPGVEKQDMEKLTYPNRSFDIVICINALDHTRDALSAVKEMLRVSKGFIYINCAIDQRTRHRKKHYWDAKPNGVFLSPNQTFDLKDYGFNIEFDDGRMMAKCLVL